MTKTRDIADLLDTNGDVKLGALDNVHVVNDTTPQLGGNLSSNGNDVTFGDNDKAIFGAGNDLQIYHDGSHSIVKDNGTGNLYLQGSSSIRLTNPANTKAYAVFNENNNVQLYYNNAEKFSTTSSGISVTGTLNATTVDLGNWTVTESGGVLFFATGGTNKAKLDASGNFTCVGDVTAFGSV